MLKSVGLVWLSGRMSGLRRAFLLLSALLLVSPDASAEKIHEVQKGHTLWTIARRYGVSVQAIAERNGLEEKTKIHPGQKLVIPDGTAASDRKPPADAERSPERGKSAWASDKPPPSTQTQKTAAERGVNPCNTPDPGFGMYGRWDRSPSLGQMLAPERGGISRDGRFDVMFHFHGHEPVRKEWVRVMDGAVLVGIDLGIGSGPYSSAFNAPDAFRRLVESVERAMAKRHGRGKARARHVGLSAWSAGYGAVQEILGTAYGREHVDSVVLLDGLHTGYVGEHQLNGQPLGSIVAYAKRAARGQAFMFVSHSSIIPPGYASTTETANYLIWQLGGRAVPTRPRAGDPMGLELISRYSRGGFHVRGYRGNDKMDHCAHIGLFRDVLKVHVKRRWNSPRGRGR
jgi:LysM repeat protein